MQCPKCGAAVKEGAVECPICFAPLHDEDVMPGLAPGAGLGSVHQMALPKEEEYMPAAGIPGIDRPGQPAPPRPNYLAPDAEPAAPLPNYLTGTQPQSQPLAGAAPGAGVRVSLTGEVIPEPPPSPQPAGPSYGPRPVAGGPVPPRTAARPGMPGQPPARPGAQASNVIPARRSHGRAEARSGGNGAALVIIVLILLAAAGGGGWWWWQQKQRAPGTALEKALTAFKNRDYKTFYNSIAWPEGQKSSATEAVFEQVMSTMGNMLTLKDFKIGEIQNNGDTASVTVTQTVSFSGPLAALAGSERTSTQQVHMKQVNGEWKMDPTVGEGVMQQLANARKAASGAAKSAGRSRKR
ncbi:MAG: hypothetical protein ACP5VE_14595 [Chthonomonadales bacterium]